MVVMAMHTMAYIDWTNPEFSVLVVELDKEY